MAEFIVELSFIVYFLLLFSAIAEPIQIIPTLIVSRIF